MQLDPKNVYEELVKLGEAWANTNAAADALEETKRTLISQLSTEAAETSATAKEMFALRHPKYIEHIHKMVKARMAANRDKVRYDSMKVYAELLRTQNANERAAMRYGA